MNFLDDSLLPENQQPLVIQVAPYGPEFLPGDSDDIPLTMAEQVQKAVDCWNAGATVLHVHVRKGLWDNAKMRVDMTQYHPLARLFGNFYASLGEPFTHVRQSYEEWLKEQKK